MVQEGLPEHVPDDFNEISIDNLQFADTVQITLVESLDAVNSVVVTDTPIK